MAEIVFTRLSFRVYKITNRVEFEFTRPPASPVDSMFVARGYIRNSRKVLIPAFESRVTATAGVHTARNIPSFVTPPSILALVNSLYNLGYLCFTEEIGKYNMEESSQELRERGSTLFKQGRYDDARDQYNEALKCDPCNAVIYSNRSAAYAKLQDYELAFRK